LRQGKNKEKRCFLRPKEKKDEQKKKKTRFTGRARKIHPKWSRKQGNPFLDKREEGTAEKSHKEGNGEERGGGRYTCMSLGEDLGEKRLPSLEKDASFWSKKRKPN